MTSTPSPAPDVARLIERLRDREVSCVTPTRPCRERPGVPEATWCDDCAQLAAADAIAARERENAELREKASAYHRRAQQAEAAIAEKATSGMSIGRAAANAGYHHWKDRAESAERAVEALRQAQGRLASYTRELWHYASVHGRCGDGCKGCVVCRCPLSDGPNEVASVDPLPPTGGPVKPQVRLLSPCCEVEARWSKIERAYICMGCGATGGRNMLREEVVNPLPVEKET